MQILGMIYNGAKPTDITGKKDYITTVMLALKRENFYNKRSMHAISYQRANRIPRPAKPV